MLNLNLNIHDDVLEIARLTNREPLLIKALGGLLPGIPYVYKPGMRRVLEVACGPGGWLLDFARTYRGTHVVGIDTRSLMIQAAMRRINEQKLPNAYALRVPTLSDQLPFDDASFDLISIQFISLFLQIDRWPLLLAECQRILRSGGILRLTEFDLAQTNAPAHEEWNTLSWKALQSSSPSNYHSSWLYELEPMAFTAGFQDCVCAPHIVNYSYGAPLYENWKRDLNLQVRKYLPQMIEMDLITVDQSISLHQRMQREMDIPSFHAIQHFLTIWGRKDGHPTSRRK